MKKPYRCHSERRPVILSAAFSPERSRRGRISILRAPQILHPDKSGFRMTIFMRFLRSINYHSVGLFCRVVVEDAIEHKVHYFRPFICHGYPHNVVE